MSFPTRKIRTTRTVNRSTLHPSVRDVSVHVIGRYDDGENLYISTISTPQNEGAMFARSKNSFTPSTVTYATLEAAARNHLPATFDTPRAATVDPGDVHRRHVAKSARLRSRLSGTKQLRRLDIASKSPVYPWQDPRSRCSSPVRPASGKSSISPRYSDFTGYHSPRSRPATTGRYFDSSNGLCTSSTARTSFRLLQRPHTASAWVGPGLMIRKMNIGPKERNSCW